MSAMPNEGWIVLGLVAGMVGVGNLDARRGHLLQPGALGWAAVALFFAVEEAPWLWDAGGLLRLSSAGLVLCAVSPVLGSVWYGHNGAVRKALLRMLLSLVLAIVGMIVGFVFFESQVDALLLGGLFALLPFFPSRRVGQWRRSRRQRRREHREERRQQRLARRLAREERRDRLREKAAQKQVRQLSRQVTSSERRLSALERGEHRERTRLDSLREEVLEQVRSIRRMEVERIRQGEEGLVFDAHYGFLMAEGWRVLRSQIDQGGYGGIESDVAFFTVVEEMLTSPDFELRYLHETGRTAMAAVRRHLRGEMAFSVLRAEVEALTWSSEILAPVPVHQAHGVAPALLDSWLLPHRRRQEMEWQRFCSGDHPQQDRLNEFFDERKIALPSKQQWQEGWDENPAEFSGNAERSQRHKQ